MNNQSKIHKGQVYTTTQINPFSTNGIALSPIKVLANVEGFVIFKRDNIKQAIPVQEFRACFIKACKYFVKKPKYEYRLSETLPIRLVKVAVK